MAGNLHAALAACGELVPGDAIEVFYKGNLVHRGPVTDVVRGHGLVWILDTLTGNRCVLELSEVEIVRLPARYRQVLVGHA